MKILSCDSMILMLWFRVIYFLEMSPAKNISCFIYLSLVLKFMYPIYLRDWELKGIERLFERVLVFILIGAWRNFTFGRGSEGTLCRPYSKYVLWHSCKSFSSSPNQNAAMAAACKWPSWQKTDQIINHNWTFVVKQPTLSCVSFKSSSSDSLQKC